MSLKKSSVFLVSIIFRIQTMKCTKLFTENITEYSCMRKRCVPGLSLGGPGDEATQGAAAGSSYNHNTMTTLKTSVNHSLQMHFKFAVRSFHALEMQAGDSVLKVVCVLWLQPHPDAISFQFQSKPLTTTSCLSETRVTTLWLKQLSCW